MKSSTLLTSVSAGLVILAIGLDRGQAAVIFDTFGANYSFDTASTYLVVDRPSFGYQAVAIRFLSAVDHKFTKAVVATTAFDFTEPYTGAMRAMLLAGSGNVPGGTVLEQFNFACPYAPTVITFNSVLHPDLAAGSAYWFAILPDTSAYPWMTYGGWNRASSANFTPDNMAIKQSSGGLWGACGDAQGTPIPAPAVRIEAIPESALQPGDANIDGIVDMNDYITWFNSYGRTGVGWQQADFNGDNLTDMADYIVWFNHHGQTGPGGAALSGGDEASSPAESSAPEPGAICLLLAAALATIRRRASKRPWPPET
ncbi:MAG: hypothetical protein ACE15C_12355 [Phycisphaerae bacterium]